MPAFWLLMAQRLFAFPYTVTVSRACHCGAKHLTVVAQSQPHTCVEAQHLSSFPDVAQKGQCLYTER